MIVSPTLLTFSDLSQLHSSQDHLRVLIVAWSASAFGISEHVLWQYLPELRMTMVFLAVARLHCRHLATSGRKKVLDVQFFCLTILDLELF